MFYNSIFFVCQKKRKVNRLFLYYCEYNPVRSPLTTLVLSVAEEVGFEPTCELPRKRISSAPRYDRFDTLPRDTYFSTDHT